MNWNNSIFGSDEQRIWTRDSDTHRELTREDIFSPQESTFFERDYPVIESIIEEELEKITNK